MSKRDYDSTVARIAGNVLSGLVRNYIVVENAVPKAVALARAIVTEVKRTEPKEEN